MWHNPNVIGLLTRTGVARVLGKTVSTVGRLEGEVLFPVHDERGVHWFEPREVERVAERMREGRVRCARGDYLNETRFRRGRKKGELARARRENDSLGSENVRLTRRVRELEGHLEETARLR